MIAIPGGIRLFLRREPTDMRCGFDRLSNLVISCFGMDPLSGHLFIFLNKRCNRMKILVWDKDGFWIFWKRLEKGRFSPNFLASTNEIDRASFTML